jgi:dihydroxy-acid dehydratase
VFEGPEDYHHRINDPKLPIDENSILFIRNAARSAIRCAPRW